VAPSLRFEKAQGYPLKLIAGVDEVGRGCLAGPVVAAAVILPAEINTRKQKWLKEVSDSKLLDHETRMALAPEIKAFAVSWAIGSASVEEIDSINILRASHLAMMRALEKLNPQPEHVLVDGNLLPREMTLPATTIIEGDYKSLSIACASIIAKVDRDLKMIELDLQYPGYGLGIHKGYSTPMHREALSKLGATELHRQSFAPIGALLRGEQLIEGDEPAEEMFS
jgi:ribonuclease HII